MLKNELTPIILLLNQATVVENGCPIFQEEGRSWDVLLETATTKVRDAWALVIFGEKSKRKLKRYFDYHLREITALLDKECECADGPQTRSRPLIELTDHLLTYYNSFLGKKISLPAIYVSWKLSHLKTNAKNISNLLITKAVDQQLANCLQRFLAQYFETANSPKITLGMLNYTCLLLQDVQETLKYSPQGDINTLLVEKLMALNFNQLLFFAYLKDEVRKHMEGVPPIEQHNLLQYQVTEVAIPKSVKDLYYDPNWPHICILLQCWLKEEIAILAETRCADMVSLSMLKKIELNLSVPQLACFIWLFFERKIDQLSSLTEIFELTAQYFSTKGQSNISPASLSNNYYGINQTTATKVKTMLLEMLGLINKHYFPVIAATGVLIGAC